MLIFYSATASIQTTNNLTWIFQCNSSIGYTHMPTIEAIPLNPLNSNLKTPILITAWQASKTSESDDDQFIMGSISYDLGNKWTKPQAFAIGSRYKNGSLGSCLTL